MADIVPVNQYDPIKAKFYACLQWLATKCSPGLITKDVAASINSLRKFDPNDPATIELLTSGVIYDNVYSNLFDEEQATNISPDDGNIAESNLHSVVINKLEKLDYSIERNAVTSISIELLAQRSALHVSSHVTLIDTMMDAYVNKIVSVSSITQSIRQLTIDDEHMRTESCSNLEGALLMWINLICDLVNERNADNLPTIPIMFDLLKDLNNGCCLAAVISYYRPNLINLSDIHNNKYSPEHKVENLSLIRNICLQQLSQKMYVPSIEDILYGFMMLKSNIIAFLSELFRLFESERNDSTLTDAQPNQNYSEKRVCSSSYSISSGSLINASHEPHDNSVKSNMLANVELSESFSLDEDTQVDLASKLENDLPSNTAVIPTKATDQEAIGSNSESTNVSERNMHEPITPCELPTETVDKEEINSVPKSIINELSNADIIKLKEARFKITSMRHALMAQEEKIESQSAIYRESVKQIAFLKILGIKVDNTDDHDQCIEKSKSSGISFEVNLDDGNAKQEAKKEKTHPNSDSIPKQNQPSSLKPASPIQDNRKGKLSSTNSRRQESASSSNKNVTSESSISNKTSQSQPGTPTSKGGKKIVSSEIKFRSRSPKPNKDTTSTAKESHSSQQTVSTKRESTTIKPNKSTHENNRKSENSTNEIKDKKQTLTKTCDARGNDSKTSHDDLKETKGFDFIAEEDNENKQRLLKFERLRHQKEQEEKARREAAHQAHEKKIEEKRKKIHQQYRVEPKEHREVTSTYATLSRAASAISDKKTAAKASSTESSHRPPRNQTKNSPSKNRAKVDAAPGKDSQRRASDGFGSKNRNGSKVTTPSSVSAASSRYGSSTSINSLGSESGPLTCYVKPTVKSNKKVMMNALEYVCLAGTVNKDQRGHALAAMEKSDANSFMVLFRDHNGTKFRGLYAFFHEIEEAEKIFGTGPKVVLLNMVEKSFKYYTGAKQFREIPSKVLSVSVDAFSIHDSCWLHAKKSSNKSH